MSRASLHHHCHQPGNLQGKVQQLVQVPARLKHLQHSAPMILRDQAGMRSRAASTDQVQVEVSVTARNTPSEHCTLPFMVIQWKYRALRGKGPTAARVVQLLQHSTCDGCPCPDLRAFAKLINEHQCMLCCILQDIPVVHQEDHQADLTWHITRASQEARRHRHA